MKLSGAAFRRRCASRVRSLPLLASSPIDSRPTRGRSTPKAMRANTPPMRANCRRCCGRHSTLAPASSRTAGRSRVGMAVASAGRSTPGIIPNATCVANTVAPVWPALNSASASRPATRAAAPRIAARGRCQFRHLNNVGRLDDVDLELTPVCVTIKRRCNRYGGSNQEYLEVEMTGGGKGAVHDGGRRMVATHRVNGDANHLDAGSLLLNRPHLPLPIKAAMGTNPMRGLRLVTLRTEVGGRGAQRVVGATLRGARLRMSAFWIRDFFSLWLLSQ